METKRKPRPTLAMQVALKQLQTAFLDECLTTTQPLSEVLEQMEIAPETLADWLADRPFRRRVCGLVRQLRRMRELQIQMAATRASQVLSDIGNNQVGAPNRVVRAACVDLIRLSRDRGAKSIANGDVIDGVTAQTTLYHPDLAREEAEKLARELNERAMSDTTQSNVS